jgi:hypothetical protein
VKVAVLLLPMGAAMIGAALIVFARVSEYLGEKQGLS